MRKTSLEPQQKCSKQKSTPKTPNSRKLPSVPKSKKNCDNAWAIAFAKWSIWAKIKMLKNMQKTSLEPQKKCSKQKSTPKTPNSRKITTVPKSQKCAIMHGL